LGVGVSQAAEHGFGTAVPAILAPVLNTNYQLPNTNYQLPIANYQLPNTNSELFRDCVLSKSAILRSFI
jgi:hypothetical protein